MGAEHTPSIADIGIFWVNFSLYLLALYFLTRKGIKNAWNARRIHIQSALARSQQALRESEHQLQQAEKLAGKTSLDAQELAKSIHSEAQREASQIVALAHEEATKISRRAQETAAREAKSAEEAIRRSLVTKVIEAAEAKVRREMTPQKDQTLRESSVKDIRQIMQ